MKQHTLAKSCEFAGYGLHTGNLVHVEVQPAPPDFGITFVRSDKGRRPVLVNFFNATPSDRCTLLQENEVEILTCEHLLSALVGLGIDNASIILDAPELPILDGSALPYVQKFLEAGIKEQAVEREYLTIDEPFEYETEAGTTQVSVRRESRLTIAGTWTLSGEWAELFRAWAGMDTVVVFAYYPERNNITGHECQFTITGEKHVRNARAQLARGGLYTLSVEMEEL